jgi:N-acyl homoserine lactone hydrolase
MSVREFYILPGGSLHIDRSVLLTAVGMGQVILAPVFSVVIMQDEGPILVDAGLNPDGLTNPEGAWGPRAKLIRPQMTEGDDIRSRLKEVGISVSDIRMVIITHLHWDHTGALRFFTHCPIVVQRAEHRFAFCPDPFVSAPYMRDHFDFPLRYQLVEGDRVLAPGVSVIKTAGHTPGHQSVLVRLRSGPYYIFPGDAIPLQDNLTLKIPSSNTWNAQAAMESIYRLEHLSQILGAEILPSHDIERFEDMKKSPEAYR